MQSQQEEGAAPTAQAAELPPARQSPLPPPPPLLVQRESRMPPGQSFRAPPAFLAKDFGGDRYARDPASWSPGASSAGTERPGNSSPYYAMPASMLKRLFPELERLLAWLHRNATDQLDSIQLRRMQEGLANREKLRKAEETMLSHLGQYARFLCHYLQLRPQVLTMQLLLEPLACEAFVRFCRARKGKTNSASNAAKSLLEFVCWAETEPEFDGISLKLRQARDALRSIRARLKKAIEAERKLTSQTAESFAAQKRWLSSEQLAHLHAELLSGLAAGISQFVVYRYGRQACQMGEKPIAAFEGDPALQAKLRHALRWCRRMPATRRAAANSALAEGRLLQLARNYQGLLCTLLFLSIGCQRRGTLCMMFVDSFERVKRGPLAGWTVFSVTSEKTRRLHGSKIPIHPDVAVLLWFWLEEMRPWMREYLVDRRRAMARAFALARMTRADEKRGDDSDGADGAPVANSEPDLEQHRGNQDCPPSPLEEDADSDDAVAAVTFFVDPRTGGLPKLQHLSNWVKNSIKRLVGQEYNLGPLQLRRVLPSLIWQEQLQLEGGTPRELIDKYASLVNSSGAMQWKHYIRVTDENLYAQVVDKIHEDLLSTPRSRATSQALRKMVHEAESKDAEVEVAGEDELLESLDLERQQLKMENELLSAEVKELKLQIVCLKKARPGTTKKKRSQKRTANYAKGGDQLESSLQEQPPEGADEYSTALMATLGLL